MGVMWNLVADLPSIYYSDLVTYSANWQIQASRYRTAWYYFSGQVLDETITVKGKPTLKYPLQINTVEQAVNMHAQYLFGQHQPDKLLDFAVEPKRRTVQAGISRAEDVKNFYLDLLRFNNSKTIWHEQARLYNVFGGAYFKVRPSPGNETGLIINAVPAEYVYPVWNPHQYDDLMRVHVRFPIDTAAAKLMYGYQGVVPNNAVLWYTETWTKTNYAVRIGYSNAAYPIAPLDEPNAEIAIDTVTGRALAGPVNYVNPVTGERMIPWVYIPKRRTGTFYGKSLVPSIMGIMDEINGRTTDLGDAVQYASHPTYYGHDLHIQGQGPNSVIRPQPGEVLDAGTTSPGMEKPEINQFEPPSLEGGIIEHMKFLKTTSREQAQLSDIMFGEDSGGSQRSGQTLFIRALPTQYSIDEDRAAWSDGIVRLGEIGMAILLATKGQMPDLPYQVDREWFGHKVSPIFFPMLPKDRDSLVNEQISLVGAGLRSKELAVSLLPDVPDVPAELEKMKKDLLEMQQMEFQQQKKLAQVQADIQAEQGDQQIDQQKQQLQLDQKGHEQGMQQRDEQHNQQMQHMTERHAVTIQTMTERHETGMKQQQEKASFQDQRAKVKGVKASSTQAAKGTPARDKAGG